MQDPTAGEHASATASVPKSSELREDLTPIRVLADDGRLLDGARTSTAHERVLALYTELVRARALDLRLLELQRSGDIPSYESAVGEEGATVAPVFALAADDAVFPGPREALASLARGLSVTAIVHHVLGSARSTTKGRVLPTHLSARSHGVVSVSGIAGAQLPHATGFGWAARMKKAPRVALGVVSGGAFVTGDFHNALNFAGVTKANVVFTCRVDRLLELERVSATSTIAEKAEAYGLPYARVDGRDALAVLEVVSAALARARGGEGATVVEIVTARAAHSMNAHGEGAVTLPEAACPIALLERHLVASSPATLDVVAHRERAEAAVEAELLAAVAEAERVGPPPRSSLVEDVYAEPPPHLRAQFQSLPEAPR